MLIFSAHRGSCSQSDDPVFRSREKPGWMARLFAAPSNRTLLTLPTSTKDAPLHRTTARTKAHRCGQEDVDPVAQPAPGHGVGHGASSSPFPLSREQARGADLRPTSPLNSNRGVLEVDTLSLITYVLSFDCLEGQEEGGEGGRFALCSCRGSGWERRKLLCPSAPPCPSVLPRILSVLGHV